MKNLASILPSVALGLLPKCPACIASYLALGSTLGLQISSTAVTGVILATVLLALALIGRVAFTNGRSGWFVVALAGTVLTLGGRLTDAPLALALVGAGLLFVGARGARKKVARVPACS